MAVRQAKLTIAHLLPWPGIGGTEHATLRIARAAAERGYRNVAFFRQDSPVVGEFFRDAGLETVPYALAELSVRRPLPFARNTLALREALETPEKTAALVTPDRALARRVEAHCARWGISIDDSAGRPLSILPAGTLLIALAEAAAQHFAPVALLALLKHPLVRFGGERIAWLDGARALDLALRGPRPAPGLDGIDAHLADGDDRTRVIRARANAWWREARPLLEPIGAVFDDGAQPLGMLLAALREASVALCGDALWAGPAGRALAEWFAELEARAALGPARIDPESLAPLVRTLLDEIAVRPPQGGHPRLAIYGLIEARLQTADLMILGGLNEGTWPGQPAPDPWLAPRIRAELRLPGLDRRVGLAAHDLAEALGAPEVLLTRARRDARAPAIPSRFWLRLEAMAGGLSRAHALEGWTRALASMCLRIGPSRCRRPICARRRSQ